MNKSTKRKFTKDEIEWTRQEVKKAYKSLKVALKENNDAAIYSCLCWMISTCEAAK